MKKKLVRKILVFAVWVLLVTSFILAAIVIQFKANGWKLNYHTFKIIKTGMIVLYGNVDSAQISINNHPVGTSLPLKLSELMPGKYEVTILKENFYIWQKTIVVEEQKAFIERDITLFLKEPEPISNITYSKENLLRDFQSQIQGIKLSGSEIYWQGKLVSRFSQNVLNAIISPDQGHIVYQMADEIRAIDIDGSNNILLLKLDSPNQTSFVLQDKGRSLYFLSGDNVLGRTII